MHLLKYAKKLTLLLLSNFVMQCYINHKPKFVFLSLIYCLDLFSFASSLSGGNAHEHAGEPGSSQGHEECYENSLNLYNFDCNSWVEYQKLSEDFIGKKGRRSGLQG